MVRGAVRLITPVRFGAKLIVVPLVALSTALRNEPVSVEESPRSVTVTTCPAASPTGVDGDPGARAGTSESNMTAIRTARLAPCEVPGVCFIVCSFTQSYRPPRPAYNSKRHAPVLQPGYPAYSPVVRRLIVALFRAGCSSVTRRAD